MRAMPSPTSRTRPTSPSLPTSRPKCEICSRRTETISPGLNLITASLDQLVLYRVQPGADAGVVQPVAHLHHQSTQEIRVNLHFQDRLARECLAQLAAQPLLVVLVERHRRADLHPHLSRVFFQEVSIH